MGMNIGFIGLGRMGFPMAARLLEAGHALTVFNRSRGAVDRLVARGARSAASPAQVAREVEVLVTCLFTPAQTEAVLLGGEGAVHGARPGQVFIDAETVDPGTSRRFAAALAPRGIAFVDAPISGGPAGAAAGTLTVMVGAAAEVFERVRPVFEAYGGNIFRFGDVGSGVAAKLCNQILTAANHAMVAEAMLLGAGQGLDPRQLFDALRASSGQSRALEGSVPRCILPRDFSPAFTVEGILKDLDCALAAARDCGVELQLPLLARRMYESARAQGHGAKDLAAVLLPLEAGAGLEVRVR